MEKNTVRLTVVLVSAFSLLLLLLTTVTVNDQVQSVYAEGEATPDIIHTTPSAPIVNQAITNTQIIVDRPCNSDSNEMDGVIHSHFFYFWGKGGRWYKIATTSTDHLDTKLILYHNNPQNNPNEPILAENDDKAPGSKDAEIIYPIAADSFYWIEVQNVEGGAGTYCLTAKQHQLPEPEPTPHPPDICEDNYWFHVACEIDVNASGTAVYNFAPASGEGEDNDFYKIWVKQGETYLCRTFELSANNDTNMIFYDQNEHGLVGNEDAQPGHRGSRASVTVNYTGWLYILVGPRVEIAPGRGGYYTYKFDCYEQSAVPFPTPTPEIEPPDWVDECEINDSFDLATACLLVSEDGKTFKKESLNFGSWIGNGQDKDYFKLWAIEGWTYTCQTYNLTVNNDTYMKIFYPENSHTPLGENDNKDSRGEDLGSLVAVDVTRTGWLLILVEPRMPQIYGDGSQYEYSLKCERKLTVSTVPTAGQSANALPPESETDNDEADEEDEAEEEAEPEIVAFTINELPPIEPSPTPTPTLNSASFTLVIYYDQNNNQTVDEGEGIAAVQVYIYTGMSNGPMIVTTSGDGSIPIAFQTPADSVRIVVPYFNIDQSIPIINTKHVHLRIAPR